MVRHLPLALLLLSLLPGRPAAQEAPPPGLFPAPVAEKTVLLRSATETDPGLELDCHYYAEFMVKEVRDLSEEGDTQIGFLPGTHPPCATAAGPGEHDLGVEDSSNYFFGAAGNIVFLISPDSDGYGGMQLSLFTAPDGKPVTSVLFMANQTDMPFLRRGDGWLRLTYDSEASAPCALATGGRTCLAALTRASGAYISLADCEHSLAAQQAALAKQICSGDTVCIARNLKEYAADPETAIEFRQTLTLRGVAPVLDNVGPAIACLSSD
jgi:hypothetical protein